MFVHTSLDDACFDSHPLCCRLAYLNSLPAVAKVRGNPFDQPRWQVLFKLDEQLIGGARGQMLSRGRRRSLGLDGLDRLLDRCQTVLGLPRLL